MRPYFSLKTAEVFEKAEAAARRSDKIEFDVCLHELQSRKRGEELVEELDDLWEQRHARTSPLRVAQTVRASALEDFVLMTDDDCHARLQMIRRARRSVWLSTYTLQDGRRELREALINQVRNDVDVDLIVHPRPITPGGHTEEVVSDLQEGGVRMHICSSHSKCVVIDEEDVMLGSANLRDIVGQEVGVRFRSADIARQLIAYLRGVAGDVPCM